MTPQQIENKAPTSFQEETAQAESFQLKLIRFSWKERRAEESDLRWAEESDLLELSRKSLEE